MTTPTIPPEALEAGAEAIRKFKFSGGGTVCNSLCEFGPCACADGFSKAALTAALPLLSGWRPIVEAPKEDDLSPILASDANCGREDDGSHVAVIYWHAGRWSQGAFRNGVNVGSSSTINPTHFMPLPQPPSGKE